MVDTVLVCPRLRCYGLAAELQRLPRVRTPSRGHAKWAAPRGFLEVHMKNMPIAILPVMVAKGL